MPTQSLIVSSLVNYVKQRKDVEDAFNKAFSTAAATGILAKYQIHTLDDYFAFYETLLTWKPCENANGTLVYEKLCLFYFVLDQWPVAELQTAVTPAAGWTWLSQWIINYAQELGKFLDTKDSFDSTTFETFKAAKHYHMEDYPIPNPMWKTFNEFFSRKIDLNKRPIGGEGDNNVICMPADSAYAGFWPIDEYSDTDFTIKGIPWNISQLLESTIYADRFKGGQFMHAYLHPYDYHRQHAPVGGTVLEAKVLPGLCYLEVTVTTDGNGEPKMVPRRRYQFKQARGMIIIDSGPKLGLVGVLPIGMAQVSSVVLTVQPGNILKKGDEISYFQMGGSDCIVIVEKKANVKFDPPQNPPKPYHARQQIGTANPTA
ncbi:phosphatidylserine decarboxylase-related protein [Agrocybe pediades]|nr:phosphatidylserine decarboxylase-related protein [Agrocybe pediades]